MSAPTNWVKKIRRNQNTLEPPLTCLLNRQSISIQTQKSVVRRVIASSPRKGSIVVSSLFRSAPSKCRGIPCGCHGMRRGQTPPRLPDTHKGYHYISDFPTRPPHHLITGTSSINTSS